MRRVILAASFVLAISFMSADSAEASCRRHCGFHPLQRIAQNIQSRRCCRQARRCVVVRQCCNGCVVTYSSGAVETKDAPQP
jgi:hypothetical protein